MNYMRNITTGQFSMNHNVTKIFLLLVLVGVCSCASSPKYNLEDSFDPFTLNKVDQNGLRQGFWEDTIKLKMLENKISIYLKSKYAGSMKGVLGMGRGSFAVNANGELVARLPFCQEAIQTLIFEQNLFIFRVTF